MDDGSSIIVVFIKIVGSHRSIFVDVVGAFGKMRSSY